VACAEGAATVGCRDAANFTGEGEVREWSALKEALCGCPPCCQVRALGLLKSAFCPVTASSDEVTQ
jgi:hypothetical protein